MLTNPQKSLLKRAQREAGLSDNDYREALRLIADCGSSTSPSLTDRHLDKLLSYFEAIHWQAMDAGRLQPSCSAKAIFRQRGFWASRNSAQQTSRDRFNGSNLNARIADLEGQLAAHGCGAAYCAAIRKNVCKGRSDARALHLYQAALERTLKAMLARLETAGNPF